MKKVYAVIDTNVLVSSMLSHKTDSATVRVVDSIFAKKIIPVYNGDIVAEYNEVMSRKKFKFEAHSVKYLLDAILEFGIVMERTKFEEEMPDPKDRVFYEVSLTGDSYLVTGNKKHFPYTPKVVTPAEIMQIIDEAD